MAKERGTFPFHSHTTSPPATCFPTVAAQGRSPAPGRPRPLPRYSQERGHRGGAGRVSAARSPAGAADAEAAVAGRPPLPASTQATCATNCRRGVSTTPNCNRSRRRCCRRRRCAAPARRPLALGRDQLLTEEGEATQHPPKVCGSEAELRNTLNSQALLFLIVTAKWRKRRL